MGNRPPGSYARNYDLSAHDLHRAAYQVACPNAIQAIVDIAGFFREVTFRLENDTLAVLEIRDVLAEASPFRGCLHSHFAALEFNTGWGESLSIESAGVMCPGAPGYACRTCRPCPRLSSQNGKPRRDIRG